MPSKTARGYSLRGRWSICLLIRVNPVAINTAVYKDYIGQYAWRPLEDVEIVSMKDGRLWAQSGNEVDGYFPLGNDSFFLKSELGIVTFLRDPQNRVTGYSYHLADGQEIHVKNESVLATESCVSFQAFSSRRPESGYG